MKFGLTEGSPLADIDIASLILAKTCIWSLPNPAKTFALHVHQTVGWKWGNSVWGAPLANEEWPISKPSLADPGFELWSSPLFNQTIWIIYSLGQMKQGCWVASILHPRRNKSTHLSAGNSRLKIGLKTTSKGLKATFGGFHSHGDPQ